jgi:hypothetical protein
MVVLPPPEAPISAVTLPRGNVQRNVVQNHPLAIAKVTPRSSTRGFKEGLGPWKKQKPGKFPAYSMMKGFA